MNIVVCIKQVPGTTEIKIDPDTNTLVREGIPGIINPFDCYALEEAVRLRERCGHDHGASPGRGSITGGDLPGRR